MQIQITVTSDFICPWCYIGEKRLALAIDDLPAGIDVQLDWLPFELNPNMPSEGMDRKNLPLAEIRQLGALPGDGRPDRPAG
jgi:predicted DsbA family dithiol-disulfide isomerase